MNKATNIVPLNPTHHHNHKISRWPSSTYPAKQYAEVTISEFLGASSQFLLAFIKDSKTGQFFSTAVVGLLEQSNVYFKDEHWQTSYLPFSVSQAPFYLLPSQGDESKVTLCIDEQSDLVTFNQGHALFTSQQEPTSFLNEVIQSLQHHHLDEQRTYEFIDTLIVYELIQPMELKLINENGEQQLVKGLYNIDEQKYARLSDKQVLMLNQKNYLGLIVYLINAKQHINTLVNYYNQESKMKIKQISIRM